MKTEFYRQKWFWLMVIAFLLAVLVVLRLIELDAFNGFLGSSDIWTAIGSLGTLLSVVVAARSVVITENTKIKQETYNAYQKFKADFYEREIRIEEYDIPGIVKRYEEIRENAKNIIDTDEHRENTQEDVEKETKLKDVWADIKKYLINVEYIATCTNAGVFDIQTIYNMGGPYMIRQYNRLLPIIYYKRAQEKSDGVYEEFEKMVKKLQKIDARRK